jgi:hypothetical protein
MKIINLLPKPRQQELRYIAMLRGIWIIVGLSLLTFILVFAGQVGTKFYLLSQAEGLKKQIADLQVQVKKTENTGVKARVKAANDLVLDFKNLAEASPKWSNVIKAFTKLPPEGVRINSLTVEPQKKAITINGFSPTRALVIQLYNNILQDKENFYDVDYPLENVARPENVNFHFTFYIQKELLK